MSKSILICFVAAATVLQFAGCDDRSEVQAKESEELYNCLCDTLSVSRGIEKFRKDANSYYRRTIPDILLATNPGYLEMLIKKKEYASALIDSNEIYKRNNGGTLNKNSETGIDSGYIEGSEYEIQILKPAQRQLIKYCRKIYEPETKTFTSAKNEVEALWTKPEDDKWARPSKSLLNKQPEFSETGFLRNSFFNWLISKSNPESIKQFVNQSEYKLFFTDSMGFYIYFGNAHNSGTINIGRFSPLQPGNATALDFKETSNLITVPKLVGENILYTQEFQRFGLSKSPTGDVLFAVTNFTGLSSFKLVRSQGSLNWEKFSEHIPEKLKTNEIITAPVTFTIDKAIYAIYNRTDQTINGENKIMLVPLTQDDEHTAINLCDVIEPSQVYTATKHLRFIDMEMNSENELMLVLLQEKDNLLFLISYNIEKRIMDVRGEWTLQSDAVEMIQDNKSDIIAINTEGNVSGLWITIPSQKGEIIYASDINGKHWIQLK